MAETAILNLVTIEALADRLLEPHGYVAAHGPGYVSKIDHETHQQHAVGDQ